MVVATLRLYTTEYILTAVKKTWRRVYERASRALPHELPFAANDDLETKRGKEKKHFLLDYLRQHMEGLRPVLPPRAEKITGKKGDRRPDMLRP